MNISEHISSITTAIHAQNPDAVLIAVSKTKPNDLILEAYNAGQRDFGENRVQELVPKYEALPKDIRWHLIGHLQSNKVKYIAPFVHLIHSVDSFDLLKEINKQAQKNNRVIDVLLQLYIASEETKFGLSFEEAEAILSSAEFAAMKNVRVCGLMGMATNTENMDQVRSEFRTLKNQFDQFKIQHSQFSIHNSAFNIISMGMSSDWQIAIEEGSTMIRVGSTIFGNR